MTSVGVVQIPLAIGEHGGVNAYLVIGERPILVDTGIPGSAPHILEALAREDVHAHDVALILITHAHVDHIGSLWDLEQATGAPVAVSAIDAPSVRSGVSAPVRPRTPEIQRVFEQMGRRFDTTPTSKGVEPDVLLAHGQRLDDFGIPAVVVLTPGHTEGSVSIVLDNGDALIGDIIGSRMGNPAEPDLAPFALDASVMLASVRKVLSLGPRMLYVGHGGPFTAAQVAQLLTAKGTGA